MGTRWIATLDIEDPMYCLLKERRISRDGWPAWDLCGVPSERIDFTTCSQGFTLGWYAMPRWGMGPKDNPDAGDASSQYGTTIKSVMRMGFWVPRWGMGPKDNPDAGDASSQYGTDDDTHGGDAPLGHGTEG